MVTTKSSKGRSGTTSQNNAQQKPVNDKVLREIERFLYREAFLLDERRFEEWVELFTDDVRYWMPVRATKPSGQGVEEFATDSELAFLDETKETLRQRIAKLATGMAWAEEPPSRTRHFLSNIEATQGKSGSDIYVASYFMVYRSRLETKQDHFVGRREDILRPHSGSYKIARRKVLLDMTVLMSDNISIFF
ncbi:MAG: 3-phenylpropionate/cinnamic acid dioxygenase subunit beta [Deltaproteobacteria bacterium]|nr:3-phenylpropionate/cinnamic acid dioxygenase subunit beta [Deltaproteobacteria bacterium]